MLLFDVENRAILRKIYIMKSIYSYISFQYHSAFLIPLQIQVIYFVTSNFQVHLIVYQLNSIPL